MDFFEDGLDITVLLGRRAGFCSDCIDVGEDFIVGEEGGLRFKDLEKSMSLMNLFSIGTHLHIGCNVVVGLDRSLDLVS